MINTARGSGILVVLALLIGLKYSFRMDSFISYIKQRSVSSILVSYSVFWCIYHWEGIYTSVFVSQEYIMQQYGIMKNEYVAKYFFGIGQDNFWNWILGVIIPAVLAFLYSWVLPKIVINPTYKREVKYKVDRKIMRAEEEKRLITAETKKTEAKSKDVAAKIELDKVKTEAAKTNPEIKWREEYDEYMRAGQDAQHTLDALADTIYEHYGRVSYGGARYIYGNNLMMAEVNGLVSFSDETRTRIKLTEKGKYFLKINARMKNGDF